ncbi:MAG: GEVED domain-containing protein [Urechidicola sp.]|nr:GEVED domain-containing protein [Urechidicola sp.]
MDYNQDGDFTDSGEQVWTQSATNSSSVGGAFTIPMTASLGATRMRVSMKYNGVPTSCESFGYGEVEDYTVTISAVLGTTEETEIINSIKVYPNPVNEVLYINKPNGVTLLDYKISNILGKIVIRDEFISNSNKIDVSSLTTGIYFLSLTTDKGKVTKKIIHQ